MVTCEKLDVAFEETAKEAKITKDDLKELVTRHRYVGWDKWL